jgi:hypothetical protein
VSAYITLATPMVDESCLLDAIVDEGFPREHLLCAETPAPLRGWQKGRVAHIVLPMERTGDRYNDIGFVRGATGFTAVLSDDSSRFGPAWLERVGARYAVRWQAKLERLAADERRRVEAERAQLVEAQRVAVHERAKMLGYRVEETRESGGVRLVLVKRTY